MKYNQQTLVLALLSTSKFEFLITGSHFFGTADEESDIDFYVQDSTNVREFLFSIGFLFHGPASYKDSDVCEVMRHDEAQIDVQLSTDANHRGRVFQFVRKNKMSIPVNKEEATLFWNYLFRSLK